MKAISGRPSLQWTKPSSPPVHLEFRGNALNPMHRSCLGYKNRLHVARLHVAIIATLAALSIAPATTGAQAPCPDEMALAADSALRLMRTDGSGRATSIFARVLAACPTLQSAQVGMGLMHLRAGATAAAESLFRATIARDSSNADAWEGLAMVAESMERRDIAVAATQRVLALAPTYASAVARMRRLTPEVDRPPPDRSVRRNAALHLTMRTNGDRFELRDGNTWRPFFIRGVNMGVAMPGKFPSEFPADSLVYAEWFAKIAAMNANAVRVYTILPPQFYRALFGWNTSHPDRPLYIVHGVWTELPPGDNFDHAEFVAAYRREARRVVDVLHGAADFATRPGHAGGRYDVDVSPWTIAYITGREWESRSVAGYLAKARGQRTFKGRFLTMERGSAIDAWLTAECDYLLAYEYDSYNALRPIAYTNWPTTDPLHHPTESSHEEQMKIRGVKWTPTPGMPLPHHEDNVSIDANLVRPTALNTAGWFASYHAYPYYPDFILYDDEYSRASSSAGRSNYFGYLAALRRHHKSIPLVIAEFGVPTSRGIAHLQPQGWHHGGANEIEAARTNARLAADIREAGAAGEIFFAWLDEWFKANWYSADFEIPADNRRQWHNILSPEQHYGLVALRPGREGMIPLPGGAPGPWQNLPVLLRGQLFGRGDSTTIRVGSDEGFVYVAIETRALANRTFPWDTLQLQLGIDTYRPELGQMVLPVSGLRSDVGFEFLVDLRGPSDAQLLVTPDYNPYTPHRLAIGGESSGEHFRRPLFSRKRVDAQFDSLYALTNRPRYARDGRFIPGSGVNMGRLVFGRASENSLADWFHDTDAGMVQIRLPWGLLNVSDPSTGSILFESDTVAALEPRTDACTGCSMLTALPNDGFRFAFVALRPAGQIAGTMPALSTHGRLSATAFTTWRWSAWETPAWHEYMKPSYGALRDLWSGWPK